MAARKRLPPLCSVNDHEAALVLIAAAVLVTTLPKRCASTSPRLTSDLSRVCSKLYHDNMTTLQRLRGLEIALDEIHPLSSDS